MTESAVKPSSRGVNLPANDARECLEEVRARLATECSKDEIHALLDHALEAIGRIALEHAGMAEELLCVYEQLGVVFEVTRKLPTVKNESEVLDLFVDSLERSFAQREVHVVSAAALSDDLVTVPGLGAAWVKDLIVRARGQAGVLVEQPSSSAGKDQVAEVMVGPVFAGDSFVCAKLLAASPGAPVFRASDMLLLESLTMFCGDLIRNHLLVDELRDTSINMVRALVNAVDQKDQYTSGHSLRVGYYSNELGKTLGLGEDELQMLKWSALLHDVGKIGIRDDVLKKEGKLTAEEFDHIKEHPIRSHQVVQEVPQLADALDGVLHHHERFDGKGYPAGLAGENIPLQARIIQIADIFDALTSNRSYRAAFSWEKALTIIAEEAGTSIDPKLQPVFDRLVRNALGNDPNGWEQMVERADAFGKHSSGGEEPGEKGKAMRLTAPS